MPTYIYICKDCGDFEKKGGVNDEFTPCHSCTGIAKRSFCSGLPILKGETVAKNIPDPLERMDREKRDLNKAGWDIDRSITHIKRGIKEDKEGHKFFDNRQADTADKSVRSF